MKVDLFDFDLPENAIALRPAEPKDSARMLIVKDGNFTDSQVCDLPEFLTSKDLIVFNDTKVIPAYLIGRRGEAQFECNLHKRESPTEWRAFAKKAKRLKIGDLIKFGEGLLTATITEKGEGGEILLRFDVKAGELERKLENVGTMPLPPYIASKRDVDEKDSSDYQTIFASCDGAVAAPTASLHFTENLLLALSKRGVRSATLTLHVGAGTFLPVKAEDTKDHKMHAEWGEISPLVADLINETRRQGGRIIAVGTTVLRLLESASSPEGLVQPFQGETRIFITPGYRFRTVDILMTNFHLPKSTLFMLVSAFAGLKAMKEAYAHAIKTRYRFYSYGDSSLLFRDSAL